MRRTSETDEYGINRFERQSSRLADSGCQADGEVVARADPVDDNRRVLDGSRERQKKPASYVQSDIRQFERHPFGRPQRLL